MKKIIILIAILCNFIFAENNFVVANGVIYYKPNKEIKDRQWTF